MDVEVSYKAHLPDLLHFATVLVGPHDASDVVSEAITATLRRGSMSGVVDARAYWFRAVSNTAASWHRSRFRRTRRERAWSSSTAAASEQPLTPDDARTLLAALSVQQRTALYLTYWLDWPVDRVAGAMGVSEGSVKQHLTRGRSHLKEMLDDER